MKIIAKTLNGLEASGQIVSVAAGQSMEVNEPVTTIIN